jgi:hypothetical protein
VKWFQLDSDTPNDPKVAMVIRQMGPAGFGALVLLWCHIADHGARPGWSITSKGKPMPEAELVDATHLTSAEFSQLVTICIESGHFLRKPWLTRAVIAIPAMASRADTYTRRRVRTVFEPTSNKVGQSSSTTQHNTNKQIPPVVPLKGGRITREERRIAERIRENRNGCKHHPPCETAAACVDRIVFEVRSKAAAS